MIEAQQSLSQTTLSKSDSSNLTSSRVSFLMDSIDHLYLHPESLSSEIGRRLQGLFKPDAISITSEPPHTPQGSDLSAREYNASKRRLFVTPFKGTFFKRCPGASQKKALTCCNYHVLNLGLQCNMNCSYCYLQSYLNTSIMTIYSNIDMALSELDHLGEAQAAFPLRVGTGEVIDSLSLDPLTLYTRTLIPFFKKYPKWFLELKTKSDHVDQFLDCDHVGNILVSWSINPQEVIEHEEHGTASLEARLVAAEKCVAAGFPISFHLDPMIYHPNWMVNYDRLIREITQRFDKRHVQGVTVGTLRFQPEQRHLMRERFGMDSWVCQGELFPSESGKLRYDSQVRSTLFRFAVDRFKAYGDWSISLCMETPEQWISTYEKLPSQMDEFREFYKPLHWEKTKAPLGQTPP